MCGYVCLTLTTENLPLNPNWMALADSTWWLQIQWTQEKLLHKKTAETSFPCWIWFSNSYHFYQWQIKENPSSYSEDPLLHFHLCRNKQSDVQTHEGRQSAEKVHKHSSPHCESRAEQHCKVPFWDGKQKRWVASRMFPGLNHKHNKSFPHSKAYDLSPISCGISWHKIATVVAMPVSAEEEKAAPTTRPSAKLWRLSPTITITASRGTPCPVNTKGVCVVTVHPQTVTKAQSCQATNYCEKNHIAAELILTLLVLMRGPPCVSAFRRSFCTLQVFHRPLQRTDNFSWNVTLDMKKVK